MRENRKGNGTDQSRVADRENSLSRRQVLEIAGATGTFAIAGCLGSGSGGGGSSGGSNNSSGDGGSSGGSNNSSGGGGSSGGSNNSSGGSTTLQMRTSTETTSAYQISQALSGLMDQNSNSVSVDARPADGAQQSMRLLDRGQADVAYTETMDAFNIWNEEGIYKENPLDSEIRQLWKVYDLQENLAVKGNSDIVSVKDLAGNAVATGSAGSVLKATLSAVFEVAGISNEVEQVSMDFDTEPSALSSGQVDAITDIRINLATPSYVQQQYSTVNNARLIHWSDSLREKISNNPKLNGEVFSADQMSGPSYDLPDGEKRTEEFWLLTTYIFFTRKDVSEDDIYELMNTTWNNVNNVTNSVSVAEPWSKLQNWTDGISPVVPVHKGAKRFYDENDISYPEP